MAKANTMKNLSYSLILGVTIMLFMVSCSTTRYPGERRDDDRTGFPFPRSERDRDEDHRENEGNRESREGESRNFPFSSLGIPKGHLPPPGKCKIWIPGKPPGQQGPPQSCAYARANAPLGAWVITHEGQRYRVNIFSRTKRNVVDEIRYYLTQ